MMVQHPIRADVRVQRVSLPFLAPFSSLLDVIEFVLSGPLIHEYRLVLGGWADVNELGRLSQILFFSHPFFPHRLVVILPLSLSATVVGLVLLLSSREVYFICFPSIPHSPLPSRLQNTIVSIALYHITAYLYLSLYQRSQLHFPN